MGYDFVTEWTIQTVQKDYADDIALVVSHTTLRIDDQGEAISYFVPITKRGERFAQTFILAGVGYDIWGIPWERLERFADLEEYNLTCLADAKILYARTNQDRERFEALQQRLAKNLADSHKMRLQALRAYGQAKDIFLEMLFASGSGVKMGAGYVLDYLARAIAFSHHQIFKRAQTDQLNELRDMGAIPDGFAKLYDRILLEQDEALQKKECYELICLVQHYLTENNIEAKTTLPSEQNYQDLADWYGELSYTWLRIRHYAKAGNHVKTYMWGSYLQSELDRVCEDFGIEKIELMQAYNAKQLLAFSAYADQIEQQVRCVIQEGGGHIREFADEQSFLEEMEALR